MASISFVKWMRSYAESEEEIMSGEKQSREDLYSHREQEIKLTNTHV